ncbi:uncharacterized protein BDR25DRAFT_112204 [Lindgomyces ingoldianus]|uniref:Uncharacterized protein n=1 Tax=Lindgomyces ingoldianus TaxID=673940 RepID=A0ACB6R6D2_9PLEO|nr:uncharacterized protein BDR25DRAFT_112204 [Lindgomyces ingoldianus]KAF2474804.1 hypothetical protein BDR25DRAFT_112204 [Lindgomyces ingoldianus]
MFASPSAQQSRRSPAREQDTPVVRHTSIAALPSTLLVFSLLSRPQGLRTDLKAVLSRDHCPGSCSRSRFSWGATHRAPRQPSLCSTPAGRSFPGQPSAAHACFIPPIPLFN